MSQGPRVAHGAREMLVGGNRSSTNAIGYTLQSDCTPRASARGAGAQPAPVCSELLVAEPTGTYLQTSILSARRETR